MPWLIRMLINFPMKLVLLVLQPSYHAIPLSPFGQPLLSAPRRASSREAHPVAEAQLVINVTICGDFQRNGVDWFDENCQILAVKTC